MWFQQDYVRGIAQHEVVCKELEHVSGTELILKPDELIFGDMTFPLEYIKSWVEKNIGDEVQIIIG